MDHARAQYKSKLLFDSNRHEAECFVLYRPKELPKTKLSKISRKLGFQYTFIEKISITVRKTNNTQSWDNG